MGLKEDVLALADDVESTIGGCVRCIADKTGGGCLSDDSLECSDAICREVAKRLRAIVERDAEDVTTMSAYDLLPEEDRKAIAWVREQGGLEAVKASTHYGAMEHGYLLKIAHALGTSIYDGTDNADALLEKLSERLMPEGMEWPRYDTGEPVRIGDEISWRDEGGVVNSIELQDGGYYILHAADGAEDWIHPQYFPGERVKRPTVLAADGEPLEVGQTVYATHYGYAKCTVLAIEWVVDGYLVEVENEGGHKFRQTPDEFIHQRPVLAADGEPLEVGQTVWHVGNGVEFTVIGLPNPGEYQAVKLRLDDGAFTGFDPDQLTHKRPVLDADGNRIEPSMDVWWVCEGDELGIHAEKLHVDGIDKDGMVECSPYNGGTSVALEPSELYVDKPVLDADGVPIRVGDTVWDIETGCGRTVRAVNDNETVEFDGYENRGWFGKFLTHAKPELDTWERIEEDALNFVEDNAVIPHDQDQMERDMLTILRRCKALAEKENRNE